MTIDDVYNKLVQHDSEVKVKIGEIWSWCYALWFQNEFNKLRLEELLEEVICGQGIDEEILGYVEDLKDEVEIKYDSVGKI